MGSTVCQMSPQRFMGDGFYSHFLLTTEVAGPESGAALSELDLFEPYVTVKLQTEKANVGGMN